MRRQPAGGREPTSLSYKFQRVRERLRRAVEAGELTGKLPGERELSRRYDANPKTINKALTDLATEGLLIRHVGRGTFVASGTEKESKDSSPQSLTFGYLAPADGMRACAVELYKRTAAMLEQAGHALRQVSVPAHASVELSGRHLSADRLRVFDGLALFGFRPSIALLASTSREHVPVVMVNNRHPQVRTAAVLVDYAQGAFELCQHLIYLGHKEICLCIDPALLPGAGAAEIGYRAAMKRNGLHARVLGAAETPVDPGAALAARDGNLLTAVICVGSELAASIQKAAGQHRGTLSLCCIPEPCDAATGHLQITSYEVDPDQIARWVADLLVLASPTRWQQVVLITGTIVDRGSTGPLGLMPQAGRKPDAALL